MKTRILAIALVGFLAGCATYQPIVPPGYTGPTATITDHGVGEDGRKGQIFYLAAVDGQPVKSGLEATRRASSGHGFSLTLAYEEHAVPVRPLRLKIVATHVTGAPIHEITSRAAGTLFSVEGETSFTPLAGHRYFVNGRLQKEGSSVWIADAEAEDVPVTEIVNEAKK